ncbi:MAG: D-amino-acid transaminase [Bacillus sp. (in: firmicutes)]
MEKIVWNGKLIDRKDVKVDIEDRGYQFGDGVYEMVRVYNGQLFTLTEHLGRLVESAAKVKIEIPYTVQQMEDMLKELVQENQLTWGTVYVQVSRGVAPRNHLFPTGGEGITFVANSAHLDRPVQNLQNGVKAKTVEDIRWLKCDIKSLNLLGNLLAKQEAYDRGCYEAIQHRGEIVTEGSSSNISIVKNGIVKTHNANNLILNGIVRQVMMKLGRKNGIQIEETPFTLEELFGAEEVFMTSTTAEIMPIIEVDGKRIGNGTPGELTRKLQALYEQEISHICGMTVAN